MGASRALRDDTERRTEKRELFAPHALLKAASTACPPQAWDLHLVTWIAASDEPGDYEANIMVFHMKPSSHGRLMLRSRDPSLPPQVERGFLSDPADLPVVVEGLDLARGLAAAERLAELLAGERRPGSVAREDTSGPRSGYFHPAGTCALGEVVDPDGRVLGIDATHRGRRFHHAHDPARQYEPDNRGNRRTDRHDDHLSGAERAAGTTARSTLRPCRPRST